MKTSTPLNEIYLKGRIKVHIDHLTKFNTKLRYEDVEVFI